MTGLLRVSHLVSVYVEVRKKHNKARGRVWTHLSDILRAAVVLCHASLEEFLRGIVYIEGDWNDEFLQKVPLPGDRRPFGGERFCLSDLRRFEDYKVADLIEESVYEHLRKRSFSRVEDVVWALRVARIPTKALESFFPRIDALMQRRHSIAHTGDIDEELGKGHHSTKSISLKTVEDWNLKLGQFFMVVADQIGKLKTEQDAPPNSRPPSQLPKAAAIHASDPQRTTSSGGCG
jgi:hypothetical protein